MLRPGLRTSSIFNSQHFATRRNRVAKRRQRVATNNVAICCVKLFFFFLLLPSIVAIVWPELANAGLIMLGYVVLKFCYRLAGARHINASTYKWILLYSVSLVSFGTGVLRCNAVLYQVISKVITLSNANRLQLN